MREGVTSLERSDAVSVDDAFASSSSGGGGFGRDGRKSLRQVANELSTGEKVAFALVALPALPLIVCFAPLLAVRVCVSKNDESTATMRVSRRRRRSPRRRDRRTRSSRPFPPANPCRFPPFEARERRRARLRARPPIPHLRVHTTPLSHSAFRLTPFPIPSSRAAAPPPPRGATSPGLLNRRVLHRPTRGFALDPGVVHDSVRGGSRHRSIRPVPPPKRGSTPSLEANAMWERTLAERSANSGANGSAGGGAAGGWSPRRSALPSAARFRGGGTHAGAEIPRAGILKRNATSLDAVHLHDAGEWNAASPSPSPSPSPPGSPDQSPPGSPDESSPTLNVSPDASSSSSVDQDEHAKASDRRVRFGSQMSVAEVNIDAQSNEPSFSNANASPTTKSRASRSSPLRASLDGMASLVMGNLSGKKHDPDADAWRVGSVLHERLSLDGTPGDGSAPHERTSSTARPRRMKRGGYDFGGVTNVDDAFGARETRKGEPTRRRRDVATSRPATSAATKIRARIACRCSP